MLLCYINTRDNHLFSMRSWKGRDICVDMSEIDKIIAIHGMFDIG